MILGCGFAASPLCGGTSRGLQGKHFLGGFPQGGAPIARGESYNDHRIAKTRSNTPWAIGPAKFVGFLLRCISDHFGILFGSCLHNFGISLSSIWGIILAYVWHPVLDSWLLWRPFELWYRPRTIPAVQLTSHEILSRKQQLDKRELLQRARDPSCQRHISAM